MLVESTEYRAYQACYEAVKENDTLFHLIRDYRKLQIQAQAAAVAGNDTDLLQHKLQTMGELLQFDDTASAFLIAEYRLNHLLSEVYQILGDAVGVDLSILEN